MRLDALDGTQDGLNGIGMNPFIVNEIGGCCSDKLSFERQVDKRIVTVLAAAAVILAYQLFLPPVTGLADQGDFVRTIGRFGYGPQHHGSLKYNFVEPKYVADPSYRSPGWEMPNSEYLFTGAALLLNRLISKDGTLDITVVGLVHALAFLAAFARLLFVTRRSRYHALIWITALVALTDAAYATYWNSFYTEPASGIFFLLALAEAIEIGESGKADLPNILRWTLWCSLWVLAKTQNAPLGLITGLFAFRLAGWTQSKRARVAALIGGLAILGCAVFDAVTVPPAPTMANAYNMIFEAVLPESNHPTADLEALGLPPELAHLSRTGAWTEGTAFPDLTLSPAFRSITPFTVLRFYLARPARMWKRLKAVMPKLTFLRGEWYGNFEPSAGQPPAALSHAFTLWSGFHEHVLPRFAKWLVFGLIAWPFVALWTWIRQPDAATRRRIEVATLAPICTLAALWSAVFGDANDLVKHLYLFNLLLDTSMIWCAAAALTTAHPQPYPQEVVLKSEECSGRR
jgi:hypothetical protein